MIATNWSGPTAFMDDSCAYPLQITGLAPVAAGPFAGHQWAAPSVTHLKQLMRRVLEHPEEARQKGRCGHMPAGSIYGVLAFKILKP